MQKLSASFQYSALIFVFLSGGKTVAAAEPVIDIDVIQDQKSLSLTIENARLDQIVRRLGEVLDYKTIVVGDYSTSTMITTRIEQLPRSDAFSRVVAGANSLIVYAPDDGSPDRRVSEVWLLETSNTDQFLIAGGSSKTKSQDRYFLDTELDSLDSKTRSEAILRLGRRVDASFTDEIDSESALIRLTEVLRDDPDIIVRSRAAIALGWTQDQRAVTALQSALTDPAFSVRTQALHALGAIGGYHATESLGATLASDENIGEVERTIAAQALVKIDTALARQHLQSGLGDKSPQVREAARGKLGASRPARRQSIRPGARGAFENQ